jgi:hypothetical protein
MRIAAGIILILAGLFNGCAAVGYVSGGAVTAGTGMLVGAVGKELQKNGADVSPADQTQLQQGATRVTTAGGGLMVFGLFLFVMLGLQIATGVVLFVERARIFAIVVGGLGLIAEAVGISLIGVGWGNAPGLLGCVLCIVAAARYAQPLPMAAQRAVAGG